MQLGYRWPDSIPSPVFEPVMMTVFPAKEVLGFGILPKSWPRTKFRKNSGDISPGMMVEEQELVLADIM